MTIELVRPPCAVCGSTDPTIPHIELTYNDGTPRSICQRAYGPGGCAEREATRRLTAWQALRRAVGR